MNQSNLVFKNVTDLTTNHLHGSLEGETEHKEKNVNSEGDRPPPHSSVPCQESAWCGVSGALPHDWIILPLKDVLYIVTLHSRSYMQGNDLTLKLNLNPTNKTRLFPKARGEN